MAKKLIPNKIIIEFVEGKFTNGVILYKVNDGGTIGKTKSVGIRNAGFSKPALNGLIEKLIKHAKKSEVITDELP